MLGEVWGMQPPSATSEGQGSKDDRILVVDDDPHVLETITEILESEGYTPLAAEDSREALAILRRSRIDVVLTDIIMPSIGGLQLLDLAKALQPHLQVLLVTAYGTAEVAAEAAAHGAAAFLEKPLDIAALLAGVREALGRARHARAAQAR